jgi:hypothetical protein
MVAVGWSRSQSMPDVVAAGLFMAGQYPTMAP